MIVRVDPDDPTPVYEQLRAQVVRMVAAGTLPAGARLPTIRQLAADLGLAKGTVAKAYEALLRDGVVESAGRRGTVVRGDAAAAVAAAAVAPDGRGEFPDALRRAAETLAVVSRQLGRAPADAHAALDAALDGLRPDDA